MPTTPVDHAAARLAAILSGGGGLIAGIAAYIRALQRSTAGTVADLTPEQRAQLQRQASR